MSGESEAKIRQLFQEAAAAAPCIVFIGALGRPLALQRLCACAVAVCVWLCHSPGTYLVEQQVQVLWVGGRAGRAGGGLGGWRGIQRAQEMGWCSHM